MRWWYNLLMNELGSLLLGRRDTIEAATAWGRSILRYRPCATIGEQTIWTMDRVLHLVRNRLVDGNRASMRTLHGSLLQLLTVHALHLCSVSLSHHHLFLMSMHLNVVSFSHLALTLTLAGLLISAVLIMASHELPIAAEIWRGPLRDILLSGRRHRKGLRLRGWLSVVLMLTRVILSQVGNGEAMAARRY